MRGLGERIEQLIGRPLGDEEPLAVAVSGGADSLALLLLAWESFGERVRAVIVDHGLRAEAAVEAAHVADVCRRLGLAHATLSWEGAKPKANVQATAREARYRLMADWCRERGIRWLATAHHADDQAETLLLRLGRGSGLAGLAGVRARRPLGADLTLLRPLLDVRRAELAAVVELAGLTPVDDPSNRDRRYDRVRIREWLGEHPELDPREVAASAAHLAEAEAALAWTADLAWGGRAVVTARSIELDAEGLPRELQRRLLLRALDELGARVPRGPDVDRLLGRLVSGAGGTLGGISVRGGPIWRFSPAPARRSGAGAR